MNQEFYTLQRTVTISQIDAATTPEERISLIQTCLSEENQSCMSSDGLYWGVSQPIADNPSHTLAENLVWETMHPSVTGYDESPISRPIFHHRIFYLDGKKYNGYIDIRTQCHSITRHEAQNDIHKCINRDPSCFKVELDVISYTLNPASDFRYLGDLDIFHKSSCNRFTMIYSALHQSGRIITCGMYRSYIPPFLASTDGLIPCTVLEKLARSQTTIPDISTIPG